MALDMTLEGRFSVTAASEAIRNILPGASEDTDEAPRNGLILTAPSLWISMGCRTRPRRTPDATIEPTSFVCFRLDKFALDQSNRLALRCVCAILEATDGDCVLMSLDIPILARISGDVRLYKYGTERSIWEQQGIGELLSVPARMLNTERPPWETDDQPIETELLLVGRFSDPELHRAIGTILTLDEEVWEAPTNDPVPSTSLVEIMVGLSIRAVELPDGVVEPTRTIEFVLDQDALLDAEKLTLQCVNAVLEATDGDCVLLRDEIPILAKIGGVTRLYRYKAEGDFWDTQGMQETIKVAVRIVPAELPKEGD